MIHGGSSKTLPKSFSKPFDKKTTEKLQTFCEVSHYDYYTPYELNKKEDISVKQEDLFVLFLNISSFLYFLFNIKRQGVVKPQEFSFK